MFDTLHIGLFIFVVAQLYVSTEAKIYQQNISTENILRKHIFNNYDKVVIPTTRGSFLKVNMRMMIKSAELDYEKSRMILSTWFIANWIDDRLTWDPDEYDQMNSIIVDHREIWHPDVMAFNNVDANMEDDRTRVNSVLNSTGSVIWVEPVQYSIHCQTDTTHWPHDTQVGVLRLGSWMYLGNVLNLTTDNDGVEVASSHSEWDIINVFKERHVRNYPCCPEEQYIDIEYNIVIKRKVHPYQSVIYIPALCSALFNLITFWLPYTDNYCKLYANLFNALFVALTILVIYSKVPIVTSTIPLIVENSGNKEKLEFITYKNIVVYVYTTNNKTNVTWMLCWTTTVCLPRGRDTVARIVPEYAASAKRIYTIRHIVYYTYSLGLIATTTIVSMVVKSLCELSKPLPHGITQFLHSGYLVYLGIETNDLTTDCHVLCESEEMNSQATDLNERRTFAKAIDRICFIVFAFVYLILLLRFMP